MPDDAFYYLVLCQNFAAKGFWTFDGEHWASGFHLLFGYLIAAIYWVCPGISLEAIYALVVIINTALVAAAVYLLARVNESLGNRGRELGARTRGDLVRRSPASRVPDGSVPGDLLLRGGVLFGVARLDAQ